MKKFYPIQTEKQVLIPDQILFTYGTQIIHRFSLKCSSEMLKYKSAERKCFRHDKFII